MKLWFWSKVVLMTSRLNLWVVQRWYAAIPPTELVIPEMPAQFGVPTEEADAEERVYH